MPSSKTLLTLKELLRESSARLKLEYIAFIRFNVFFISIAAVISYLVALLVLAFTYNINLANILHLIISIPLLSYFGAGFVYYYASFIRGITTSSAQIFRGYRWYLQILIFHSLLIIIGILCIYPVFTFSSLSLIYQCRTVGSLLFYSWFLVRSAFVFLIIVDENENVMAALKKSFQITRYRFFEVFSIMSILLLILFSGLLFFGIGFILTLGLYMLAYILYYDLLRKEDHVE